MMIHYFKNKKCYINNGKIIYKCPYEGRVLEDIKE